jgi:hypothetical protein
MALRGWPALGLLIGLLGVLGFFIWNSVRSTPGRALKIADVKRLENDFHRDPHNPQVAVDLLFTYAILVNQVAGAHPCASGPDELARLAAKSGEHQKPADRAAIEARETALAKAGITSNEEWEQALGHALELAEQIPAQEELDPGQRAAVLVAAGQISLDADRVTEAVDRIAHAETLGADPVAVAFVRADILVHKKRFAEAISELHRAKAALGAWADKPPSPEMRLLRALAGKQGRQERQWRQQKQELAQELLDASQSEIMILKTLDSLQNQPPPRQGFKGTNVR